LDSMKSLKLLKLLRNTKGLRGKAYVALIAFLYAAQRGALYNTIREVTNRLAKKLVICTPHGLYKVVDVNSLGMFLEEYELRLKIKIKQLIEQYGKGRCLFIDVGAHVGFYTIMVSKLCERVIAIEPNPETFKTLLNNLELNKAKNVTALQIALSDRVGEVKLWLADESSLPSIVFKRSKYYIMVNALTLDALLEKLAADLREFEKIIIKIDVEGAEEQVIKGGLKFIKMFKPIIIVEIHSEKSEGWIEQTLRGIGYRILKVNSHHILALP